MSNGAVRKSLVAQSLFLVLVALAAPSLSACDPPATEPPPATPTAAAAEPPSLTPFVVDSRERSAELEVAARRGAVVVAYDANGLTVARDCAGIGTYAFAGTAPEPLKKVFVSLAAELPFRGKTLEKETQNERARGAIVTLLATSAGAYTLDRIPTRSELRGDCARATHVVTSILVGAFAFEVDASGAKASLADTFRATPGPPQRSTRSLERGGDNASCFGPTPNAPRPPPRCDALIRIALAPLDP